MSHRTIELGRRETTLRLRCAAQRAELGGQVDRIESRLQMVDRVVTSARGFLLRPAVIAGTAILLVLIGRDRTFRVLGRGLLIVATARRLSHLLKPSAWSSANWSRRGPSA
jgi:hypothetical protein